MCVYCLRYSCIRRRKKWWLSRQTTRIISSYPQPTIAAAEVDVKVFNARLKALAK